ncbi:hypothetical protein D3C83_234710 [compost metagenome]
MKKNDDMATNGIAHFFSCEYRPGATNSHTCSITAGDASRSPASRAILMYRTNASVGSV